MTRVLFGLSGDGRGHSSRSKATIEHLIEQGHEVRVFTSGKGYEYLSAYFDIDMILGFHIASAGGSVHVWDTIRENSEKMFKHTFHTLTLLSNAVDAFQPDVIISDFEPLISTTGAIRRVPVISVDNQHIISLCNLEYPREWMADYLVARTICDNTSRSAKHFFVTSFFSPELKPDALSKTTLVGPIQRKEVLSQTPGSGEHILVYIRTPDRAQSLLPLFEKIDARFVAYGFETSEATGNVTFKKSSDSGFLRDLADCRAVITNGGHSLISEALYLGKPVFSIPTRGDFEQMLNAHYVERLGYGLCELAPSHERLRSFLDNLEHFRYSIEKDKDNFNGNERFFELLDARIEQFPQSHHPDRERASKLLAVRHFSPG